MVEQLRDVPGYVQNTVTGEVRQQEVQPVPEPLPTVSNGGGFVQEQVDAGVTGASSSPSLPDTSGADVIARSGQNVSDALGALLEDALPEDAEEETFSPIVEYFKQNPGGMADLVSPRQQVVTPSVAHNVYNAARTTFTVNGEEKTLGLDNLLLNRPDPPQVTSEPQTQQDWLRYSNQGATRNQPISNNLQSAMSFLGDMGITMEVFSGGQPSADEGGGRVGSVRHDHGEAADVFFYQDGRKLNWANEADRPIFQQIVTEARQRGITGIGAGPGYMREGAMHIGFGQEAVWGVGGRAANAPQWLRDAFYATSGQVQ